jgi:VanZ family protein
VSATHCPSTAGGSPLARAALAAFALLVVYASLAPWSGWQDRGLDPLAFVTAPWPRYVTGFDLGVNVLAYAPLGALAVLALYPRLRGLAAVALASAAAALLSAGIEALQTFLPARVASNVDWLTNTAGAAAGALLAAPAAAGLIERGRLRRWRRAWFTDAATPLLLLAALWPLAQLHPTPMLFGLGWGDGAALGWARAQGLDFLPDRGAWQPADFRLAEAVVSTAGLLAAGLALASAMQPRAPRLRLLAALIAAALAVKAVGYGLRFGPEHLWAWLTPGAASGLALGGLALVAAASGRPAALAAAALLATAVLLASVAVVPDNPYFASWMAQWRSGRLAHFNAAAEWLASGWPFALLLALLAQGLRRASSR